MLKEVLTSNNFNFFSFFPEGTSLSDMATVALSNPDVGDQTRDSAVETHSSTT